MNREADNNFSMIGNNSTDGNNDNDKIGEKNRSIDKILRNDAKAKIAKSPLLIKRRHQLGLQTNLKYLKDFVSSNSRVPKKKDTMETVHHGIIKIGLFYFNKKKQHKRIKSIF